MMDASRHGGTSMSISYKRAPTRNAQMGLIPQTLPSYSNCDAHTVVAALIGGDLMRCGSCLRLVKQPVGSWIADNVLLVTASNQFLPEEEHETAQVAERRGALRDLDVHRRSQVAFWFRLKSSHSLVTCAQR